MGFRNPITTAEGVDTGVSSTGPGVRMYQQDIGTGDPHFVYPQGVVEFRDGTTGRPATITRDVVVYDDLNGLVQVFGGSFTIDAGSYRGVDAGSIEWSVTEQGDGSYRSKMRLRADRIDLGPVARLLQTAGSGDYPAGAFGTVVFHTAEVDPYGGFVITAPATVSSRWTCPPGEGGLYAIAGRVPILSVNPGNVATARLLHNGAPILGSAGDLLTQASPAGSSSPTTDRVVRELAPGEYVELQGFVSGQLWRTRVTSDGVAPALTIERVG